MDTRKEYTKPTVESGEMLEQTSLACNVLQEWGEAQFPFAVVCGGVGGINVAKGGAWSDDLFPGECTTSVTQPVVFS